MRTFLTLLPLVGLLLGGCANGAGPQPLYSSASPRPPTKSELEAERMYAENRAATAARVAERQAFLAKHNAEMAQARERILNASVSKEWAAEAVKSREAYIAAHPELSDDLRERIRNGKPAAGMDWELLKAIFPRMGIVTVAGAMEDGNLVCYYHDGSLGTYYHFNDWKLTRWRSWAN